jgi:sigma-B regulation protein RsbU (phosphoserine phosphatase)
MLLGYFVSSAITRRIQSLQQSAEQLAGGDLSTRSQVAGRDEVAALAGSFNHMAERLQEADRQQREPYRLRRTWSPGPAPDLQPC